MPSEDGRHSVDLRFETSQAGQNPRKKPKGRAWRPFKEGMGTSLFEREKLGEVGGPSKAMNIIAKWASSSGEATRDHFKHRMCRCAFKKG